MVSEGCKIGGSAVKEGQDTETVSRQNGLVVDQPLSGGTGTSNDGNTARRASRDPKTSSEITGVDEEAVKWVAVVLNALQSLEQVDSERFGKYAMETAEMLVHHYPWFYMPASIHKLSINCSWCYSHRDSPASHRHVFGRSAGESQQA